MKAENVATRESFAIMATRCRDLDGAFHYKVG